VHRIEHGDSCLALSGAVCERRRGIQARIVDERVGTNVVVVWMEAIAIAIVIRRGGRDESARTKKN
jgi:hypothetical protein